MGATGPEHIARHGVTVRDVSDVVYENRLDHRLESDRLLIYGRNRGGGLFLVVLDSLGEGRQLVVAARPLDDNEKSALRERRKL